MGMGTSPVYVIMGGLGFVQMVLKFKLRGEGGGQYQIKLWKWLVCDDGGSPK